MQVTRSVALFRVTDNKKHQLTACSVPRVNVHKCSGFSHFSYTECSGSMFVPSLSIDLLGLQR